ncbi:hypothetical protein KAI46_02215, partial [bacterium]|nr:hypothetical protein [bacterium]
FLFYLAGLPKICAGFAVNFLRANDLHQPPRRDAQRKKRAAIRGRFCMLLFGAFLPIKLLKTVVCP